MAVQSIEAAPAEAGWKRPRGTPSLSEVFGSIHEPACTPLADVDIGETVEIRRVDESEPERLRYLALLGLMTGVVLTVVDRQPFGAPVTLDAAGERHIIGAELAQVVLVAAGDQA